MNDAGNGQGPVESQRLTVDVESPAYWKRCGVDKSLYMLRLSDDAPMMVWALYWAARSFDVFPVCMPNADGQCGCGRRSGPHVDKQIGKAPLITNWPNEATRDPAKILQWW